MTEIGHFNGENPMNTVMLDTFNNSSSFFEMRSKTNKIVLHVRRDGRSNENAKVNCFRDLFSNPMSYETKVSNTEVANLINLSGDCPLYRDLEIENSPDFTRWKTGMSLLYPLPRISTRLAGCGYRLPQFILYTRKQNITSTIIPFLPLNSHPFNFLQCCDCFLPTFAESARNNYSTIEN